MQRNTLVTISDNKIGVSSSNANLADFYEAQVLSATDYYAFGMSMKERTFQSESYRYGFNGKEKDKDFGEETTDFGARLMNSKIGRWMAVDPLVGKTPDLTPYRFGFNNPIRYMDSDGRWEQDGHYWTVYAVAVLLGIPKVTARELAIKAEWHDHHVNDKGEWSFNGLGFRTTSQPQGVGGVDIGLGTWAWGPTQREYHGLTGGTTDRVRMMAVQQIFSGNLYALHLFGDSYAHSKDTDGNKTMYGKPNEFLQKYLGIIFTFEHMGADDGGHGQKADNIADRPELYLKYVSDLTQLLANMPYTKDMAKNTSINATIFKYIAEKKTDRDTNIFLLGVVINMTADGQKEFKVGKYSKENKALTDYFDYAGISYSTTRSQNTIHFHILKQTTN